MGEMADQLASAVRTQWQAEAKAWRIYDPPPLPVSWVAADKSLVDTWEGDLAGEDDQLAAVLARVPTGRLVVLGEPGSGKTVLMVRLVLDLLAHRAAGDPVPVLLPIASWNPEKDKDLLQWITSTLSVDYPAHMAAARNGRTRIDVLVSEGLILPILDGLDEIPDALRATAIAAINDSVRPGERFVLTSRTSAYEHAVRPNRGIEVTLRGAAAVEMRPLGVEAVAKYLRTDAGGPRGATRWDDVIAHLGAEGPIAAVLSNPLMVGLARLLYNPRPGRYSAIPPDPSTLCDFDEPERLKDHLFDGFIPAAYRAVQVIQRPRSKTPAAQAEHWLAFLAYHLENTVQVPDFAWWRLGEDPSAKTLTKILGGVVYVLRIGTLLAGLGALVTASILALRNERLRWQPGFPIFVHGTASWHLTATSK